MKNEVDEGGGELSSSSQCERGFGYHQRAPMHACTHTHTYAHMHTITEVGLMLSVESVKRKDRGRKLQKDERGEGICVTKYFLSSLLLNLTKGFHAAHVCSPEV